MGEPPPRSLLHAPNGIIISNSALASQAGIYVLQEGGTAADAIVAALSVSILMSPWIDTNATVTGLFHTLGDNNAWKVEIHAPILPETVLGILGSITRRFGVRSMYDLIRPGIRYAELAADVRSIPLLDAGREAVSIQDFGPSYLSALTASKPAENSQSVAQYVVVDRGPSVSAGSDVSSVFSLAIDHRGGAASIALSHSSVLMGHELLTRDGMPLLLQCRPLSGRVEGPTPSELADAINEASAGREISLLNTVWVTQDCGILVGIVDPKCPNNVAGY